MKKPPSINLTKFDPAQMPGAGVCWCLSLPGRGSAEIFLLGSLTLTLHGGIFDELFYRVQSCQELSFISHGVQ